MTALGQPLCRRRCWIWERRSEALKRDRIKVNPMQRRFFGVLFLSALLHGALLCLPLVNRNRSHASTVVQVQLRLEPTAATVQPRIKPRTEPYPMTSMPASNITRERQRDPTPDTLPDTRATNERQAVQMKRTELTDAKDESRLNLSPDTMARAASESMQPGLAQAVRAQLSAGQAPPSTVLARKIASAIVPDCLHEPRDGEAVIASGLLALPFMAYAAATGKCK